MSPILTGAPADAQLQNVQAVTDFDVSTPHYPLIRLSADDFELLNYALFKVSAPAGSSIIWDSVAWMLRGADAGRDLVLFRAEKLVGGVQCKRLESPIALPDVLREIIKSILFTVADDSLPPIEPGLTYYLALASEAAGTVIDFFQRPAEILASRKADLPTYVREVIEKYDSLSGLDEAKAIEKITTVLSGLKLKLVRPSDLSLWLAEQTSVASRFFRYRVVVDSSEVGAKIDEFAQQMQRMQAHLEGVPFVTDVDLNIIRDRIEDTPETHRIALGLATLFGFPREMFVGKDRLKARVGKIAEAMNGLYADYIVWLNEQAAEKAVAICNTPEVIVTVHPFARQMAMGFLGLVVAQCLQESLSGKIGADIVQRLTKMDHLRNDDERMNWARERILSSGRDYLRGDYSKVLGDAELVAFKRRLIDHMMQGLTKDEQLVEFLDRGIAILRPKLLKAAEELRTLGGRTTSIYLMGPSGIDSPENVKRMSETVKDLDAKKNDDNAAIHND